MISRFVLWLNSPELLQQVVASRFFLIVAVVFLSALKHFSYSNMFAAWSINILGTVFHEAAHFTVGFILNAKPVGFTVFPKKVGDTYVLGSVGFNHITFYNAVPSAMAPLLLMVLAFYIDKFFFDFVPLSLGSYLLFILVMSILAENAVPSAADFKVVTLSPASIILYAVLFGILLLRFVF